MLISLQKIAEILGTTSESTLEVKSYFIDSRKVSVAALFFALKGERVDGHDYLEEVALKGAYAAVVHKDYNGPGYGLLLFFVDDVLESMQHLSQIMLQEKNIKVIAVTGSVGKTTTKEMIYHILSMKYKVHRSEKSYNSQAMLPISILKAKGDEDYMVLEMAMYEKGEIKKLSSIAPPHIVVLTPITYCHSENFESLDEIAEAKAEIFSTATEYSVLYVHSAKYDAVYRNCLSNSIIYPAKIPLLSPYKESHFTDNFVAAYEVAKYVGMSDDEIRLASLVLISKKISRRFEKIEKNGILFIDDSYNANELSTYAALNNLPVPKKGGRKIFVFGEMMELGSVARVSHSLVTKKALEEVDIVLTIGRETKDLVDRFNLAGKQGYYHYEFRSLKERLFKVVKKNDVVLIKGSKVHKLWKLLEDIPILQE